MIEIVFYFIILLIIFVILRMIPFLINPELGIDNWFWLLMTDEYKKQKKVPVKTDYFLLEEDEMWYPPLFYVLLGKLPDFLIKKKYYILCILFDLLNLILIYFFSKTFIDNINIVFIISLLYVTFPMSISYNFQLNPRVIGVFLLNLKIILLNYFIINQNIYILILVLFISGIVLLLHKMTTQVFWFILLILGIYYKNLIILLIIPGSIISALILSKGFYIKVLRAHWDIVRYWTKNIKLLGAHLIYDSEIYKKAGYESPFILHKPGIKGVLTHLLRIFAFSPLILIIFLPLINLTEFKINYWYVISLAIYAWVFMTTFIPYFKSLGAGYYYTWNASFSLLVFLGLYKNFNVNIKILLGIIIILNLVSLIKFYRNCYLKKQNLDPDNFNKIIEFLKKVSEKRIFCLPYYSCDRIAYETRNKVFWGGHGYGFKDLQPYFPVITKKIDLILNEKKIDYVVFNKNYIKESFESLIDNKTIIENIYENDNYIIYGINK